MASLQQHVTQATNIAGTLPMTTECLLGRVDTE